jgi:ubiquinone/menaquinone biosynthesis C-methylase UbiE
MKHSDPYDDHKLRIVEQFTRQATPFSTSPGITDEAALQLIIETSGACKADTVLDVACGPGLVVCALAAVVSHATGIDLTPAMIDRARQLQSEKGLTNVTWNVGDVLPLPYPDASFSMVVSRFAFHHFLDPAGVLCEMRRVVTDPGRVVLVDITASSDTTTAEAYNIMEKLRDPSHVRALPLDEMEELFANAQLSVIRRAQYQFEATLDGVLDRSFPAAGDKEKIRQMFEDSLDHDRLGVAPWRDGDQIRFAYPITILVGTRR